MKRTLPKTCLSALVAVLSLLRASPAAAGEGGLSGDIGVGALRSQAVIRGDRTTTDAIPYLAFDYGPVFARIDTFGVKTLPVGYGSLELVGQYRGDGYRAASLQRRSDSVPLGVGTLQVTPVGAFGLNALHDFGKSGGTVVQARYLGQLAFGRVTVYPELGVEYEDSAYTRYYYGTTAADAAAIGRAWRPGAAVNPYAGVLVETRITEKIYLNAYFRQEFLGDAIGRSPLVGNKEPASLLLALAYRF